MPPVVRRPPLTYTSGRFRLLNREDYLHRDRYGVELAEHMRAALIRSAHEHGYAAEPFGGSSRPAKKCERIDEPHDVTRA
jgi:hypothetical protein